MGHLTFVILFILLAVILITAVFIWALKARQKTAFYQHVGQFSYLLLTLAGIIIGVILFGICYNSNWI